MLTFIAMTLGHLSPDFSFSIITLAKVQYVLVSSEANKKTYLL